MNILERIYVDASDMLIGNNKVLKEVHQYSDGTLYARQGFLSYIFILKNT